MTGPEGPATYEPRSLAERLARLEAIEEIKRLKAAYFRYLDLHWWDELRRLFTDDAVFDIAESTGAPSSPDEFLDRVRRHLDTALTVHHGHMPEITVVDEDHAHGVWAMYDLVEPAADSGFPVLTGFGHYTERYRRVDAHWRICGLRLTRLSRTVDGRLVEGDAVAGARSFDEP